MYTMYTRLLIAATLLARWRPVIASPTWPAPTDELEDILFLTTGYRSTGFASAVTPCSKGLGPKRVTAAEWLRTAFHDAISGNIYTGVGGLDGSIAWELDSLENEGTFAKDSVAAWAPFVSDQTSLSDVIAAATYTLTRSCSNISVAVRGGRVDATEEGPSGFVPQPQNAVSIFRNQFARMGLDDRGMVQFVACGHSLGGVHGADHPEITNQDLANFDTTPAALDNSIAKEFVSGATTNPLVVGQSVANKRNSDFRVFSQTDQNATIRSLAADPQAFANACQSIFQTMIDLVPAGTQLSDSITPYEAKPYALQLTLLDGGSTLKLTGEVRIRTTHQIVSEVTLMYVDRNGAASKTPISTVAKGLASGFDDSFSFHSFSASFPVDTSISSFVVSVTYADSTQKVFDNNGSGFRVEDTVIYQAPQSCLDSTGKLTVVAAARNETTPSLQALIKVSQAQPNPVPSLSTTTVPMAAQSAVGPYRLYSADLAISPSVAQPPIFAVFAGSVGDTKKDLKGLPTSCMTLGKSSQTSRLSSSSASSDDVATSTVITTTASSTSGPIESSHSASSPTSSGTTTGSVTPTPTSATDFTFQGCYYDAVDPRALKGKTTAYDNMTVDACAATCKDYLYFGLEYSQECYCGNDIDSSSTRKPATECNMPCGGSSTQSCGGYHHIDLYTNLRYTAPVNPSITGYDYQGCYSEGNSTRALLGPSFDSVNMTVDACANLCKGATYFGVEYSRECYCGTTLQPGSTPRPAPDCAMPCAGNATQLCGAPNRIDLYRNSTAPLRPVVNPPVAKYSYAGCYTDSVESRVLGDTWTSGADMTVEACAANCAGFDFFGTEYGAECFCGRKLAEASERVVEGECGMVCKGDEGAWCGGVNRLSVYRMAEPPVE